MASSSGSLVLPNGVLGGLQGGQDAVIEEALQNLELTPVPDPTSNLPPRAESSPQLWVQSKGEGQGQEGLIGSRGVHEGCVQKILDYSMVGPVRLRMWESPREICSGTSRFCQDQRMGMSTPDIQHLGGERVRRVWGGQEGFPEGLDG